MEIVNGLKIQRVINSQMRRHPMGAKTPCGTHPHQSIPLKASDKAFTAAGKIVPLFVIKAHMFIAEPMIIMRGATLGRRIMSLFIASLVVTNAWRRFIHAS